MRWSRFALAGFLVLGLTLVGTAGTDNAKKIVGHWVAVKADEKGLPKGAKVEFTKDGKLKIHVEVGGKSFDIEGTYKVKGNKLYTKATFMGETKEDTDTIKSLSDDRLVTVDSKGVVVEFQRVKKKKAD
jgi:uncharacterized protein (TIGR03066 family)